MKDGTPLPEGLDASSNALLPGWRTFANLNGYALTRKIEASNWHFFCLAGAPRASALGGDRQTTLQRAVKQILAKTANEKYNALEVTKITAKRFLGVPYLRVCAHLRHIQEGILLVSPNDSEGRSASHVKSSRPAAIALPPAEDLLPAQP